MMRRALLRAPLRCSETASLLPMLSNTPALHQTFPISPVYKIGRGRGLTSTARLSSDRPPASQLPQSAPSTERNEASLEKENPESSQHVPWYLEEETSIPASAEVLSKDQIPELPENPPKILPVLLEYVFKDLGLDELKLIDLRGLETPPALGANVIMIIGTTRSVKHLNVSADRLCRWLRSNWKLSPYADGLLGRNELKIKLRRKARRARLASRTGALFDDKDDGITTGWICVNAGIVEKGPVQAQLEEGFEGFGTLGAGTRIVVQLFTEEKRAEVDLDGLWQENLARAEREKQKHSKLLRDAPEQVRSPNSIKTSPSDRESRCFSRSPVSLLHEQRRLFHGSPGMWYSGVDNFVDGIPQATASQSSQVQEPIEPQDSPNSGVDTRSLFSYLSELTNEKVISELGNGPDDRSSTVFLRLFYHSLSGSSTEDVALALAELTCIAISCQHTGYSKESLYRTVQGCFVSGCHVPEELASLIVTTLLAERQAQNHQSIGWLPESDKQLALAVLDHLSLQGMNFMTLETFNKIYAAVSLPPNPREEPSADGAYRVARIIDTLDLPFDPEQSRIHMAMRFRNDDIDGFWKWWRKLPLNGSPRTSTDYELLFQLHTELGDVRRARDCLSAWAPMMSREDPPIPLEGGLVHQIMSCILLAEPQIERLAEEGYPSLLAQLWRECQDRIEE